MFSTLKTDTVMITVEPPPTCPVTQLDFDEFAEDKVNYFELEALAGEG